MEKVLITGGNGFLGSHLAEKFLSEGIEVTVIDDLSTSKGINVPKEVKFKKGSVENTRIDENFSARWEPKKPFPPVIRTFSI